MFERLEARTYQCTLPSGRTSPMLVLCEATDGSGDFIDVIVKLSAGCDLGEKALIREAFAAFFAADLNLPVPCPYAVLLTDEFIQTITDERAKKLAASSCRVCFGSNYVTGFQIVPAQLPLSPALLTSAADIFAFDAAIGNFDRRVNKPNCLHNAQQLLIIDHESAFSHFEILFGPKLPWEKGMIQGVHGNERHLFFDQLRGQAIPMGSFERRVDGIKSARFNEYAAAIPVEWFNRAHIGDLVTYLNDVKANIQTILLEVARALS